MSGPAEPHHEVRKTVTVVFVDVTGSTALGERLDPERVRRVMRSYFAAMREILERHGGSVEKFIGDAVMAVFGVPTVHEDDALRACRAAIEIRERLHQLNAQLEQEQGFAIEVRTGVNSGEVVAEEYIAGEAMVVGDAVNVAARLEQQAAPGEILLGASTHRMVRDAVRAEATEPMALKGKAAAVSAYWLLDVNLEAEPVTRRLGSPIVGRGRELQIMRQAFERATAERALQLLTVLGTAGVGKSRLIQEFAEGLDGEHQILRGRCLTYGDGVTYLPLAAAIKAAAQITDAEDSEDASKKIAALVEGEAEGDLIHHLIEQILGMAPATAPQEELFWAARRLLEVLATRRPLVVVLDDIHWAEPTLLDLIEHLAEWSRDAPILLVCSARPELFEARPTWGGGKLNAASMLLEPLGDVAADQLLDNLVGVEALPPASRRAITSAAEGNPLFVEEMLGVLIDDGVLRRVDGRWEASRDVSALQVPPTIQALLAARLDRLDRTEREVAQVASVVGRVFDRSSVETMVGDVARPTVRPTIMSLVRKDLIRPDRSLAHGVEGFRFRHVLIRDAAYDGLAKEDRSRLHQALADWLETTVGDRKAEHLEIIGYHLEQAYRYRQELGITDESDEHVARRAAELLADAGRRAIARTDISATVSLMERAISLLPQDDPLRLRLLPELANSLAEVDPARAKDTFREAIERANAAGQELLRAHAVVAGLLIEYVDPELLGHRDRAEANEREAERAIKVFADAEDHVGLSRAWRLRGGLESSRGRLALDQEAIEKALQHARVAVDAREQAECVFELSFTLTQGPTPVEEAIRRCTETLAEYAGNRSIEGWMLHALAHMRARQGEGEAALALAGRCRQILLETGQQSSYAALSEMVADVHMLAGNAEAAIEVLRDGMRIAELLALPHPMLATLTARALCAAERYEDAEPLAIQGITSPSWVTALAKAQLAKVRAHAGAFEEAERLAREAVAWFAPTDWALFRPDVLMDLAEVLLVSDRPADARKATEDALQLYRGKGDLVSAGRAEDRLAHF